MEEIVQIDNLSTASQETSLNERIQFNVGGQRFETYVSTLTRFPDTLLGAMFSERNRSLLHTEKEAYFFDRDPHVFEIILNFYRTGQLFISPTISLELITEELIYFQIPFESNDGDTVHTVGRNEFGQLGHGDKCTITTPVVVEALQNVSQISIGTHHSVFITHDYHVYACGYGGDGRLGLGTERDQLIPILIQRLEGHRVIQAVCGELHTACLTESGHVFTFGLGKNGRLGHFNTTSHVHPEQVVALEEYKIVEIACGGVHTAALTSDGQLFTFGLGKDGRLGHGNDHDQLSPKRVVGLEHHSIVQVACGGHHTGALTAEGEVYTFGFDDDGRLGHNCTGHVLSPKQVEALAGTHIRQISCGCWHSAALSTNDELYTWGSNKSGQLGHGHKKSVPFPQMAMQKKGGGITMVACGTAHTAVLLQNGQVFTWGKAEDGRLGYESKEDQTTPKLVNLKGHVIHQVVCGVHNTAFLTRSSSIMDKKAHKY